MEYGCLLVFLCHWWLLRWGGGEDASSILQEMELKSKVFHIIDEL